MLLFIIFLFYIICGHLDTTYITMVIDAERNGIQNHMWQILQTQKYNPLINLITLCYLLYDTIISVSYICIVYQMPWKYLRNPFILLRSAVPKLRSANPFHTKRDPVRLFYYLFIILFTFYLFYIFIIW